MIKKKQQRISLLQALVCLRNSGPECIRDWTSLYRSLALLIRFASLELLQNISQPLLMPKTQYPSQMLVVEAKARRIIPAAGRTYGGSHLF